MSDVGSFDRGFRRMFEERFPEIFRYLDRLSGDALLAADIAQEAFIRLHRRGEMPDDVRAWLITVANNLYRDERRRTRRRLRLLGSRSPEATLSDPPPAPDAALGPEERRREVRAALEDLPERDRQLLLLRHEGYSYRELAQALGLAESSVGTLLARASEAFRASYEGRRNASDGR